MKKNKILLEIELESLIPKKERKLSLKLENELQTRPTRQQLIGNGIIVNKMISINQVII